MRELKHDGGAKGKGRPADATDKGWIDSLPWGVQPYLRLSRFDRPAGFWLLALPCWIGVSLVWLLDGFRWADGRWIALFLAGATAMRGAGCVWNDLLDRRIDARVRRTRERPLASGRIRPRAAVLWLLAQCGVGLGVLLCLPDPARLVALAAIPLVAVYPLTKRVTWWPQVWLGVTFSWGLPVAVATLCADRGLGAGSVAAPAMAVYLALVLWTLGYDTIYAIADKADDELVGVRSTALLFGVRAKAAVAVVYVLCVLCLCIAALLASDPALLPGAGIFAAYLFAQVERVEPEMGLEAIALFRSNVPAGAVLTGCWGLGAILAP